MKVWDDSSHSCQETTEEAECWEEEESFGGEEEGGEVMVSSMYSP